MFSGKETRHRHGFACKALQNQQSDDISQMAANISALESSKNALCAWWMLEIPPDFSGCYVHLCFNVLELSHVLKKVTVLLLGLLPR